MWRPAFALLLVFALFGAACVAGDDEAGPNAEDTGSAGTESVVPDLRPDVAPEGAESLAELSGRLAIVDRRSLVVIDPDGANRQIFDEADAVGQPTWSPTGRALAWTRWMGTASLMVRPIETAAGTSGGLPGRDADPGQEPEAGDASDTDPLELGLDDRLAVYVSWSDSGDRVAVLRPQGGGRDQLDLAVTEISLEDRTISPLEAVASGRPLYSAWHPAENRFALHLGERVDQWPASGATPGTADPDEDLEPGSASGRTEGGGTSQVPIDGPGLFDTNGAFAAPAWLDDESVVVADGSTLGRLSVVTGEYEPLVEAEGATRFVVSPDGSRIAYLAPAADDVFTIAFDGGARRAQAASGQGSLHVLDVESSQVGVVGAAEMRRIEPLAWEWSPDGQLLAFLADSELDPSQVRWYFWHAGSIVAATSIFIPSPLMARSYLPFFDQYAQSITGWSPDGQAFAFAGAVGGVSGVYVHVLRETPRSIRITDGEMVTWSPENVAPGTGESFL